MYKKEQKEFYLIVRVTVETDPSSAVFPPSDMFSHGMNKCLCGALTLWPWCPDVIINPLTKPQQQTHGAGGGGGGSLHLIPA